jgi:hypothetical protein
MILRPRVPSPYDAIDRRTERPRTKGHEGVIKLTSALVPNPLSIRPFTWSSA